MTSKTIALSGAEIEVSGLNGANAHIRNDGTDVIYASTMPGITAGADGVISIPAGQAAAVYGACGTVYLIGTGSVQLVGSDYTACPFKTSAQAGGSGADEVARAAINEHSGNAEIHVTADEKARWNAVDYSNPNLLINPDFKINQRGYQIYHAYGGQLSTETEKYNADYFVDGWKFIYGGETAEITDDGIVLTLSGNQGVKQPIDSKLLKSLGGKIVSFSIDWELVSGNYANFYFNNKSVSSYDTGRQKLHFTDVIPYDISDTDDYFCAISGDGIINVYSVKMEVGSTPTEFLHPDPTLELLKCQRYYQIRSTGDIPAVDLRPTMRISPSVTQLDGGNFAYTAEF